ncbi:hypothetical protein D8B26_006333 [Coccidioides posadasii str. Silveira]|uniref:Type 1 inositol-1,4,5-trisphosphate 5-phosphatase CVP2 n=1 Tax=Coccidioides posadasii (strain RMSCC 757 / Silveira) TaxID=443226 RepID=E9CSU4_COCPS|nr:type 1 inositol-1,4,5-trisphosphate 5-phosphatase CVP2 [Coccidioides posadasii str. Silveira]QVM11690.1 hypothetical protein D8B26_006333 [Coccidioides posadasii str. Silveira]
MDRKEPEDTEQESIRPVSSLLSHFENLAQSKRDRKAPDARDASSSLLKTPASNDDIPLGRASLDLPRPEPPWVPSRPGRQNTVAAPLQPAQTGDSPSRRRFGRPLSMHFHSTSPRGPTLTVESPRSPPSNGVTSPRRSFFHSSRNDRDLHGTSPPMQRSPNRSPIRPKPSLLDSPGIVVSDGRRSADRDEDVSKGPKSFSQPPPVNRAEKPKIPAKKPGIVGSLDTHANSFLVSSQRTSFEDRVSPFSTPPSSPEKSPPLSAARGRGSNLLSSSPSSLDSPSNQPRLEPRSSPRPLGGHIRETSPSTQTKPKPIPNRDTKPPPPPPPVKKGGTFPRSARPIQTLAEKLATSDEPEDRPGLPPRSKSPSSRRAPLPRPIPHSSPDSSSHPSPLSVSPQLQEGGHIQSLRVLNGQSTVKFPPPPPPRRDSNLSIRISSEGHHSTPQTPMSPVPPRLPTIPSNASSKLHISSVPREEVAEPRSLSDEASIPRMDYPDASHTNRRAPVFRTGTRGIHTKHDTRIFDVCGSYACSTGFFTKVWNLVTGEQILNLSHGESVKGLSIAFKPGRTVDEEGKAVWIGLNTGEICEVDITTQAIISSRFSPSRREVIKMYRYRKELWTLDDDGKLLVWPPDESGSPNLQYSYNHPYDRVPKGPTFSMVVDGILWYATGKEIRLYRPSKDDDSFQVLRSPLGKVHSGDVTSGTACTKRGVVYLGHADGKVTMYSSRDFTCLGTVNVSVYKISSLAMVGDYLWAGYKTGMIYVYDISTDPWTVKKDWEAHHHGVCGMLLDHSSIWTVNRLQVVSLGVDNYIRAWDGMLEDDWLEAKMQGRDVEYCEFREITAAVLTWNAGAAVPGNLPNSNFIGDAIHPENPPDILVFGFQELVDLENKKITAKSLLKGSKKKDHDMEHVSRRYRVWRDHLAMCIREFMPLDTTYVLLHTASLIGLFTCVFVKQDERQRITNISAAEVKRGMGGLHGNKGALILRFILDDTSVCFVNCHLAAGQTQTAHRNNDIAAIMESESLPMEPSSSARIDRFVGGGDGSMILDHEICILNGDLNYRIDSIPRNTVLEAIKANNLPKLLDRDQLLASKRKNPGFRLRSFNEAPITFAPTYKYDVGTDNYDSSEKKRSPAWCDRLLYRGVGRIKQLQYRRHEVRVSDHRPVSGLFKMRIKTISPKQRTAVWEVCQAEFLKEKRRLATEASIDYLVRVLGADPKEAESLISSPRT